MTYYEHVSQHLGETIKRLSRMAVSSDIISNELYERLGVKRGLRDIDGKGVVCGLTEISEIVASETDENGVSKPARGRLFYRGHEIDSLVNGFVGEKRLGFEETAYLLLTGSLPSLAQLSEFNSLLSDLRSLPDSFVRDVIMKATSPDMMNLLSRSVLTLYTYDPSPDDTSVENVMRQVLSLLAMFPMIAVYGYKAHKHYHDGESLIIHHPLPNLSTAENILRLLRPDGSFTELEARILDVCLVLHAEHGGGNNSTFTTHVVTSSGTDTYSTVAASLGSLKGPRHGGANVKVHHMFNAMKTELKTVTDQSVSDYLERLLNKDAFDKAGLIYGMGHAIYSLSDPRSEILRKFVKTLAEAKNLEQEYALYEKVERLAPMIIAERRKIYKGVSANVDFYSGLVYTMLGIPPELFTPIFAVARMAGWGAHRIEEISNNGKIIRPGYTAVAPRTEYVPLSKRAK